MKRTLMILITGLAMTTLAGCGNNTSGSDGTASSIAAGAAGGASNDNISGGSSSYAMEYPKHQPTMMERLSDALTMIPELFAFQITCTGGTVSPNTYTPGTTYSWTPISCSLTFRNGKQYSVSWSGVFDYNYSAACTGTGFRLKTQPSGCVVTRTTPSGGNTRTATRFSGEVHAVTVDTTAPSGYNSAITTSANGASLTAEAAAFASRNISISGTHLSSTLDGKQNWDHTISTDPNAPLAITGVEASKVLNSGTIIVQHNLAKFTTTTTVATPLAFTNVNCCFPTSGALSTAFSGGANDGKTELLTFSADCGEATLTNSAGQTSPVTLSDCL